MSKLLLLNYLLELLTPFHMCSVFTSSNALNRKVNQIAYFQFFHAIKWIQSFQFMFIASISKYVQIRKHDLLHYIGEFKMLNELW